MKNLKQILIVITLIAASLSLSACPIVRGTGNAVQRTGEGVAHGVEGVGKGVGHAVEGTGRAIGQTGRELAN